MKKANKKSVYCSSCKEKIRDTDGKKELVLELQKILENAEILQDQSMVIHRCYSIPGLNQNYGDKFCSNILDKITTIIGSIEDEIELRIQEILNSK